MTEVEMVGRHHQLNGREFEQAPGVGDGQGSLACCSPWGHKELDTTERLNRIEYLEETVCNTSPQNHCWVKIVLHQIYVFRCWNTKLHSCLINKPLWVLPVPTLLRPVVQKKWLTGEVFAGV